MELIHHFRRQFAYDQWANLEVLAAVRAGREASARSLQLVAHVLAAERLWMERIKAMPASVPVWPESDLEGCEAQARELGRMWREYLDAMPPDGLAQTVSYKNSKGEPWSSTLGDILNHVILHAAYHRGQIASHMREKGQTPAYTDFVHAVRQGLVE